jgi:hypothetical protein
MARVKLDALREGMVVAAEVKNMDDMLLIPAGCEITQRHIKVLRTWGISEIQIDGGDPSGSTTLLKVAPEVLERMSAELRALFWAGDDNGAPQQEIFRLALRQRVRTHLNQPDYDAHH